MVKLTELHKIKSFNRLIEDICAVYDIPNKESLRDAIQNEIQMTISQYVDPKLVPSQISPDYSRYIISGPVENLDLLCRCIIHSDGPVDVLIKVNAGIPVEMTTTDIDGDVFNNTPVVRKEVLIPFAKINRDENKKWTVRVVDGFPVKWIDVSMYATVYDKCYDNKVIKSFLNDVYSRVNQIGKYSPTADPNLAINESVKSSDDTIQYEVEFNPDHLVVFIHENILKDHDDTLLENDLDHPNEVITQFFKLLFNTDKVRIEESMGSLSKAIIDVGASYMLGKSILRILDKAGAKLLTNPNSEKYQKYIDQANMNRMANNSGK